MARLDGYRKGINLSNWLTVASPEHHASYITEDDIARIASWGMDHVRLLVYYNIFEDDSAPGIYKEEALDYIDRCIEWCKTYDLNLIFDLHRAPGFYFYLANSGSGTNTLFSDETMQERFINIWRMFAKRYASEGRNVIFELLNEVIWESSEPWNKLWLRAVEAIREIDGDRTIAIGGNFNNSVAELKNLAIPDDPGVVYTFHFYEPGLFTHQRMEWIPQLAWYKKQVQYPFRVVDHIDFFDAFKEQYEIPEIYRGEGFDAEMPIPELYRREVIDKSFIRNALVPAQQFMQATGKELFCGEFGTSRNCGVEDAIRWFRDIIDLFKKMNIAYSVFDYTVFSFVMRPQPREVDCAEIIKIISE